MDASEQFAFPTPQPNDSAEVRTAIERAGQLWSEDPRESLRCLRQAAEAASDAGDDLRSVQLARISADLRNLANISASAPPPATMPPRGAASPGAASPGAASPGGDGGPPTVVSPESAHTSTLHAAGVSPLELERAHLDERHTEPGNPGMPMAAASTSGGEAETTSPGTDLDDRERTSAFDAPYSPAARTSSDESADPITSTNTPRFDTVDEEDGDLVSDGDLMSSRAAYSFGDARSTEAETTPNAPPVSATSGDEVGGGANPYAAGFGGLSGTAGFSGAAGFAGTAGIPGPLGVAPGGMALQQEQQLAQAAKENGPTAEQVAAMVPRMMPGKDPAQTVPATPAASAAAAALASGPTSHQSMSASNGPMPGSYRGSFAGGGPLGGATAPGNGEVRQGGDFGARRPAAALIGNPPGSNHIPPRAEQPTLIGRPGSSRGLHDQTPAATPAAMQAESSPPASLNSRFVQHRAIAVAISTTPNSSGHFDLHPLAEGEQVEPGFRAALLVGLTPNERIIPGRE